MSIRTPTLVVVMLCLAGACADDPASAPAPRTPDPTRAAPTATPAPTPVDRPFRPTEVELEVTEAFGEFEAPTGLVNAGDGSRRMFVLEQAGTIRVIEPDGATREQADDPSLFLDISDRISTGGERGLLGLAFHPRYETNGFFYVDYTDTAGDTVVAEYRTQDRRGDPDSERVLLRIDQPFPNHNGGDLTFGPDGYLYIASGDGGSGGDPENNGQRLDTLLGKMLRIDVDARDAGAYGIPPDNPFVGDPNARPEIWAYGLRNPWQFSFDRETGDLWIADVGQGSLEEVDREPAGSPGGVNYGWRVLEGSNCYETPDCDRSGKRDPVATYSHELGCSVTGGYVYRGDAFPRLKGAYITGDYCSGNVWALPTDIEGATDPKPILSTESAISSFGEDEAGELYMTDHLAGRVLRITARPS